MQITGDVNVTFILLSGIVASNTTRLSENVELLSADASHLDLMTAISTCSCPDDIAVVAAFIPRISAQFKVTASTPEQLAVAAWNASWDALLLSAFFHAEVGFNLQSDTPADEITSKSKLRATNYHMHELANGSRHELTVDDCLWIASSFSVAQRLLKDSRFETAVHCLASYRWHSMPRVKLAVLWAGIEGVFGASSEIRFRISLYIARFLHPVDVDAQRTVFAAAKRLYDARSAAVHGSAVKNNMNSAVDESAEMLRQILLRCVANSALPQERELVP